MNRLGFLVLLLGLFLTGCNRGNSGSSGEIALPNSPSILAATVVSTAQINLTWTDNSDNEVAFKLERKLGADGAYAEIISLPPGTNSYVNTGLAEGNAYCYRIRASNGAGNSDYSNEVSVTTALAGPTRLYANMVSSSQIILYWSDNSRNETGFKIERSTDGATWTQIDTAGANTFSYNNAGLAEVTTYYYRVKAYNSGAESAYSASVYATTPLYPPSSLNTAIVSSTRIDLAWLDNSNKETGYRIERKSGAGGTYAEIATPGANTASYSDTNGLVEGIVYYYRVRAYDADSYSLYSNDASSAIQLNGPTSLIAATISSSAINLNWTDNSANEDGFKIERSTLSGSGFVQVGTVGAGITSYASVGLFDGTRYYYKVCAYNAVAGNSPYSGEANAVTALNEPQNLQASTVSSSRIDLNWVDFSNSESEFRIERSPDNIAWAQVATATANSSSYNNTGLADGTEYWYRVRAYNTTVGNGSYSNQASATTILNAPSAFTATAISSSQINLNWTNNSANQSGFKLARSLTSGSGFSQIMDTAATSYNNTGLTDGTVYYYQVMAYNAVANSSYSNEAAATTTLNAPTSLNAVAVSPSQINLNWTDNSGSENGYKIERKKEIGGTYEQVGTVGPGITTYPSAGLDDASTYYYQVRAYNTTGNSAYCAEDSATTLFGAPSNLTATAVSSSQINLSWADNSNHEDEFKIERSLTSGSGFSQVATTTAGAAVYSDTGLPVATEYYYRVRAYNAALGDSAYSNEASAATPLNKATNPNPANGSTGVITTTVLSWTAVAGATSYDVYMGLTNTALSYQTNVAVTNYTPGTFPSLTTYYWRIDSKIDALTTTGDIWSFTTAVDPSTWTWIQRTPSNPPTARRWTGMAYDSSRGKMIISGGMDSGGVVRQETYEYDGTNQSWTQKAILPEARRAHALAYAGNGKCLVFGGLNSSGSYTNTSYLYDSGNDTWSTPSTPAGLTARRGAAMAYDSDRNVVVLFGGYNGATYLQDTWEWDCALSQWSSLAIVTAVTPSARSHAGMAYHFDAATPANRQMLLYGGYNGADLGETWQYTGSDGINGTWTNLNKDLGASPARDQFGLAYNSMLNRIVLFGGTPNYGSGSLQDTWLWDGSNWNNTSLTSMPSSRCYHGMAYDTSRSQTVLFGGALNSTNANVNNETWEYGNTAATGPTVVTSNATNIAVNSAQLNGTVNPRGLTGYAYFEYGALGLFNNSTASQYIGAGLAAVPVTATLSGLTSDTTYNFRMVGVNGNGANRGIDRVFTTPIPPQQVTGPVPADGALDTPKTTPLSWNSAAGATSYDVYFGAISPGTFIGNQTGTTYNPDSPSYGAVYYWRIDSVSIYGTTAGLVWNFTVENAPGAVPAQVTGPNPPDSSTVQTSSPALGWSAASGAVSYDIYFGITSVGWSSLANITSTGYAPAGPLANNTVYYWRVDSVNGFGTTPGVIWSFTTSLPHPGTGADGALDVAAATTFNINTQTNGNGGRTEPDGWSSQVSSLTANTATLAGAPPAGALNINDEVILISLKGSAAAYVNVGNYEFLKVASVAGAVVNFQVSKTKFYGAGAADDDLTGQFVMLQRLPNYTNVAVQTGSTLTCNAWNGTIGGVLAFRANGTVSLADATSFISVNGLGHRGGVGGSAAGGYQAPSGESYIRDSYPSGGGVGSGYNGTPPPAPAGIGGGGGGAGDPNGSTTVYLGATGTIGPAGGGGGSISYRFNMSYAGGAGGAGHGSVGGGGQGVNYGASGSGATGGTGGNCDATATQYAGGAGGGGTCGISSTLNSNAFLGAGGGAGGCVETYKVGASGGNGGGLIFIGADTITNNGTISANGANGANGSVGSSVPSSGPGGGGAGGSIIIIATTLNNNTSITANGGIGGNGKFGTVGGVAGGGRTYAKYNTRTGNDPTPNYFFAGAP